MSLRPALWVAPSLPAPGDEALLDPGERARRDRLLREEDRQEFAAAHVFLRRCLSRCAPVSPQAWRFAREEGGRPVVAGPAEGLDLRFSLSHAAGWVAVAVARAGPVGVDLERIGRVHDPLGTAAGFFSPGERAALARHEGPARDRHFAERWCLKEAWAKALGGGLDLPVERAEFSVGADGAIALALPAELGRGEAWRFELFEPAPGWVGALCWG